MDRFSRLDYAFYSQPTLIVATALLGKQLVKTEEDGSILSGLITEVESYIGTEDLACHARNGPTKRNQVMFGPAGRSYVYLTYGIHWMLNIVTEKDGFPAAVLIRGVNPVDGIQVMKQRRESNQKELSDGPAKLTQAFGINRDWNNINLCDPKSDIYLNDLGHKTPVFAKSPRIGINRTPEPWLSKLWNFKII
jgi:DNA-3-methyladenine glycosylase